MATRQDYRDGKVSHDDYYLQLAREHHIALTNLDLFGLVSLEQLREFLAADRHLNNIPLRRFDAMTASYNAYNPRTRLSFADGCCIYKALLKQLANTR